MHILSTGGYICIIDFKPWKFALVFKIHNDVSEYLLSAAELLNNEPTLRYATDKAWHVDFNCFLWITYNYILQQTPHSNPPQIAAIQL